MNFGFDCEISKRFNKDPDFKDFIRKCIKSFEHDHPAGLTGMSSEFYFYRDCMIGIVANDSTGNAIVAELCRY